jgi:NADH dehydrogenase
VGTRSLAREWWKFLCNDLAKHEQLLDKCPARSFTMRARIFRPAKTAMSSGTAKTKSWVLEHVAESAREVDPLMGWTSSTDTQAQVRLEFDTKDAALAYAAEHGIDAAVQDPKPRKMNIRAGGYAENFATNRRGAWTH